MAADNNLIRQARKNIEVMLTAKIPNEYNLLVYIDSPRDNPYLLKITKGKIDTVKQYNTQNSASKQVLKSVISDAFSLFPAENYGIILWSHGTSWLPEGVYDYIKETNTRSFGKDKNKEMEITDLAEALPENLEHIISNENDLIALRKQISRAVIYNDFTPYFLDEFPIEKSCGIGIYIPFENDALYEPYSSLDWYKDSGLFCI